LLQAHHARALSRSDFALLPTCCPLSWPHEENPAHRMPERGRTIEDRNRVLWQPGTRSRVETSVMVAD
jgi:hypothetical protein